jgi:hypothetical protein
MNSLTDYNSDTKTDSEHTKYSVGIDTGTQNPLKLRLFEVWLTIWCQRHCHNLWALRPSQSSRNYQFVLEFEDAKEAILFKLASSNMMSPKPIDQLSFIAYH